MVHGLAKRGADTDHTHDPHRHPETLEGENVDWMAQVSDEEYRKVGRMGKPEEIAAAVVWLCPDTAAFVTGHAMVIDGGQTA